MIAQERPFVDTSELTILPRVKISSYLVIAPQAERRLAQASIERWMAAWEDVEGEGSRSNRLCRQDHISLGFDPKVKDQTALKTVSKC